MTSIRTVLRSSPVRVFGIGLALSLAIIFCRQLGVLETVELSAYDWTVRLASPPTDSHSRIVLITITEEDIQHLGQWPISDESIAKAVNILTEYGPRAIGLDLYRDKEVQPGRDYLNTVLSGHPEIVTVMKFPDQNGSGVPGPAILQGTDQIGFNDILVDPGGIVRRGFLFLEDQRGIATSFSLLLALKYLEKDGVVPTPDPHQPEFMRLGKTTIPRLQSNEGSYVDSDANGYQMLVKFSGTKGTFERFSLTALLSGKVPKTAVEDKVIIIGTAAVSVRDDFYTPLSHGRGRGQQVPGMEVHAHIVDQFLRMALQHEPPLRTFSDPVESFWIVIWGGLGALLGLRLFSPWRVIFLLGGGVGLIVLTAYGAFGVSWWIPLVPPVMAWLFAGGLVTAWMSQKEKRERMMLMKLFSQHVSPEVAETIWMGREEVLQDGRIRPKRLTATVLFADLEGFTGVAEQLDSRALMEWVNTYLKSMANVIAAHDGVVDDFFGDGVKANFGIPVPRASEDDIRQDAMNAVQCGLAIMRDVIQINQLHEHQGIPKGKVRIGIATGDVVVGSVGSKERLKYTTVGDIVNTAARLEQLGKEYVFLEKSEEIGSLIITKETKNYLDTRWEVQDVDELPLPGKQESVKVYRVLSGPTSLKTQV